jgi:hypothetical protein
VVVDVDEQRAVDGPVAEARVRRRRRVDDGDVRQPRRARGRERAERGRRLGRDDRARRPDGFREVGEEEARAAADVRDRGPGADARVRDEGGDDVVLRERDVARLRVLEEAAAAVGAARELGDEVLRGLALRDREVAVEAAVDLPSTSVTTFFRRFPSEKLSNIVTGTPPST